MLSLGFATGQTQKTLSAGIGTRERGPLKALVALVLLGSLLAPLPEVHLGVVSPVQGARASDGDWNSTIQLNESGNGGDWLFFYHVLDQPLPAFVFMRFNGTFTVHPVGNQSAGVLDSVPDFVSTRTACCNEQRAAQERVSPDDTYNVQGVLSDMRAFRLPPGEQAIPVEEYLGAGASAPTHAISFVIGADVPWTLNLTFQMVSGQNLPDDARATVGAQVLPTFLYHGSDMSLRTLGELPGPALPDGHTTGSIAADIELESPGWTHIQYDWYNALDDWRAPKQPFPSPSGTRVGVHQYRTTFPNGFTEIGPAAVEVNEPGAYFPIPLRAWGTMADVPGNLHVEILRADNSVNVSATVVHLPMPQGTLPAEIQLWNYQCQYFDLEWRNPGSVVSACDESETNLVGVDGGLVN